jgi:hypothetical protein
VLVSAHDGGIDHGIFVVGIACQMLENSLPDTANGPSAESRMHHSKIAESLRKIAPRNPGTIAIENSFDKQTVVLSRAPDHARTTWQQILHPIPLIVPQPVTPYTHPLRLKITTADAYSELDDTP